MFIRTCITGAVMAFVVCASGAVSAADTLRSQLVGSWKIVSVYDQFADGSRRNTWGSGAQGQFIFTPGGQMSFIIVGSDRPAKAGGVPSEPVGPAFAGAGTYSVDEGARTFSTTIEQSTFPQWQGQTLLRRVEKLDGDELKFTASSVTDANGAQFVPHLELTRMK